MAEDIRQKGDEALEKARELAPTPPPKPADETRREAPDSPVVARPVRRYRAFLFQIYLIIAVVAFAALFVFARQVPYFTFDLAIERAVQSVHTRVLDILMEFVTGLGFNPLSYLLALLIVALVGTIGLRWEATMLVFAAVGVSLLGALVKLVVQRHRPSSDLVNVFSKLNDFSFPSGHVLLFTAFLGFLLFLIFTLAPRSPGRMLGIVVLGLLIALVGVSRIYLGQHWPSDVIGGYLLGSLWLTITVRVYQWGKPRFFTSQPIARETPQTTT